MNSKENKIALCFGEVLWDKLPDGAVAGGAPMNVAIRLASLGIRSRVISAVGNDLNGNHIKQILRNAGVDTSLIEQISNYSTGEVNVTLNDKGNASYDIVFPVAWDFIEYKEEQKAAAETSDVLVFGSLACRNNESRQTLFKLLPYSVFKVFDINLRPPHYEWDLILELMAKADMVKLNDEELDILASTRGHQNKSIKEKIADLALHTNTPYFCITRGSHGAMLWIEGTLFEHEGFSVDVVDTVGAGDSFLATLIAGWLNKHPYNEMLENACAMGSLVASKKGATALVTQEELDKIKQK